MPSKIIKTKSSRKFNTKFGYYSLRFEDYLNKNYELKIWNIKKQIKDFIEKEKENVQFFGLFDDVKSFLNMSFFRNPRFIEEINKVSLSSRLMNKGFNSEDVAFFYNQFGTNILKNMSIYLIVNKTEEGLILSGEIFSNISIKENVQGLILPLNPKFGVMIVPTEYYVKQNKIYSDQSYMVISNINTLHIINQRIYADCKKTRYKSNRKKEDLEKLLSYTINR